MDLTFNSRMEEYYQRFIDLQDKLRKSEEERLKLEVKFNELLQVSREEEQNHYRKLRSQYKRFLDEDRKRQERNEKILRALERIETRVNALMSKSERFKLLRRQYQKYLNRLSHVPEPDKLNKKKFEITSDRNTNFDHPGIQKALQKSNEEKLELLDQYLQSLQSQKVESDFRLQNDISTTESSKDLELLETISDRLNRNFDSNKATSIAEEIMNSIYSRHYNKDITSKELAKPDTLSGNYNKTFDSDDDDYDNIPKQCTEIKDNKKPGGVLEHLLNRNTKLTTQKNDLQSKSPTTFNGFNETDKSILKTNDKPLLQNELRSTFVNHQVPNEPQNDSFNNMAVENIPKVINNTNEYPVNAQLGNDSISGGSETTQFDTIETFKASCAKPSIVLPNYSEINQEDLCSEFAITSIGAEQNQVPFARNFTDAHEEDKTDQEDGTINKPYLTDNEHYNKEIEQTIVHKKEIQDPSTIEEPKEINKQQYIENEPLEYAKKTQPVEQGFDQYTKGYEQPITENDNFAQYDENRQPIQPYNNEHSVQQYDVQPVELETVQPEQSNEQIVQPYGEYEHPTEQYGDAGQEYSEHVQYDEHGQPFQYSGETDQQYYDESGQPLQYEQRYDENGQPVQQFDVSGQPVPHYDQAGQPVLQYDEAGQPAQQYDENGQPVLQYDEHGQPVQQYHENMQSVHQFDENGQTVQQYHENVQPVQQFDENGQPVQPYDENIQQFNYQYDENGQNGQPIVQYDENGQVLYQPQYDEQGQIIEQYDGQPIHSYQQEYDESGQPIQPQYDENVQHIQQQPYDTDEPPVQQYDENGQPLQAFDEHGQTYQNYEQVVQQFDESAQPESEQQLQEHVEHFGEHVADEQGKNEVANNRQDEAGDDKKNVLDILDTDTESVKQNTSKISNDSDFDFSNG